MVEGIWVQPFQELGEARKAIKVGEERKKRLLFGRSRTDEQAFRK